MAEWQYAMTVDAISPEELDSGGEFDGLVHGHLSHLQGDGWELVSHDISLVQQGLALTLVWRRKVS